MDRLWRIAARACAILCIVAGYPPAATAQDSASPDVLRVTLLGTGAPDPTVDRFSVSTLIEAGHQKILIDAGRGVTMRLSQLNIPLGKIEALFLTQYHSDHTVGVPDLWLTGWLPPPFGQRRSPFHVIGPTGAAELMTNLERAYAADIRIRMADQKLSREGVDVKVDEFSKDGTVYENDGLRVTAFEVNQGEAVKPAYGYRIDYAGHAVLVSGDTKMNENVVKYGTGTDLLVHEVFAVKPELMRSTAIQRIAAHHVTPQQAGVIFTRAHPRLAVYTHLSLIGSPTVPSVTTDEIVSQTRETYGGPLVIGEDLMAFEISAKGIAIYRRGSH
ncbi:Ribonuclease Z [Paraburkholderia piptadeniae]|uniref:Ribonuclease Z n=1 Tax=Paraburkholderia piptadeniae TaxID=1701573 RepID=A0A1N7SLR4_9BURK|nr:MBL fold metallo-hydrolase [Paraburkholderia piptadeniae]SIT47909.1 Ribonuclease Z [Paraburkholderia piptadeniae]